MNQNSFQKRIAYQGNVTHVLQLICERFTFGEYLNHRVIEVGYEDFNLILETSTGKYFLKLFAEFKDEAECRRYVEIIVAALAAGVRHPRLFESSQGYLNTLEIEGKILRFVVMEYLVGQTFYDLGQKPTPVELRELARQAALINHSITFRPPYVYDAWSITHLAQEFEKKKDYLEKSDLELLEPLVTQFKKIDLSALPHCFVHGDMIETNVLKASTGEIYILDFSVANYYPRIQELAVLFCDIFFDEAHPDTFPDHYQLGLEEYQKKIHLTDLERATLPLYTQAAHAVHVINATYEQKMNQNRSAENDKWINLGQVGLRFSLDFWSL
jgi:Ser/Thr protein kinase RdoA (MazF antagonist)